MTGQQAESLYTGHTGTELLGESSVSVMVSLLCCGPKMAACGIVLSVWGVIMLVLLGIFFNVHSAVLIEDVPFSEADMFNDTKPPTKMYALYEQVSYNCFIAAAIYVLLGGFSFCQARLNKRKEYMVR